MNKLDEVPGTSPFLQRILVWVLIGCIGGLGVSYILNLPLWGWVIAWVIGVFLGAVVASVINATFPDE